MGGRDWPLSGDSLTISISPASDALTIGTTVRAWVRGWGYGPRLAVSASAAAVEMASDVLLHGGGVGSVILRRDEQTLQVSSQDHGPTRRFCRRHAAFAIEPPFDFGLRPRDADVVLRRAEEVTARVDGSRRRREERQA